MVILFSGRFTHPADSKERANTKNADWRNGKVERPPSFAWTVLERCLYFSRFSQTGGRPLSTRAAPEYPGKWQADGKKTKKRLYLPANCLSATGKKVAGKAGRQGKYFQGTRRLL